MTSEKVWNVEEAIPQSLRDQIEFLRQSQALKSQGPLADMFAFLHIVRQLKVTRRTGWVDFKVDAPESIADHMYRMGIISMLSTSKDLDSGRCVKMALVHDMAESVVGDITPVDPMSKEEKHHREYETMKYLTGTLLAPFNASAAKEIMELWEDYENIASPEARFVKDVDKYELLMQCLEYERDYEGKKDLSDFLTVRSSIKTPEVSQWADAAIALRHEYWDQAQSSTK